MAEWAIMNWVRNNKRTKIWAVLPVDTRAALPLLSERGHWEEYRRVDAERFLEHADAEAAIKEDGFYFVKESVAIGPLAPTT